MRDTKYWRRLMEAEHSSEIEDLEEPEDEPPTRDAIIMEELVFPFGLSAQLLQLYEDPAYGRENLGEAYPEFLGKLLRSLLFWKIPKPKWLVTRMKQMQIL